MRGQNCIKTSSTTQSVLGLSTGESEFQGLVKASSLCLGAAAMATDLGQTVSSEVLGDSTAAEGIGSRTGVGRLRHLHLPLFWVQDFVRKKLLTLVKRKGTYLSADLGTKHVIKATMLKHLADLSFSFREGQADKALKAALAMH